MKEKYTRKYMQHNCIWEIDFSACLWRITWPSILLWSVKDFYNQKCRVKQKKMRGMKERQSGREWERTGKRERANERKRKSEWERAIKKRREPTTERSNANGFFMCNSSLKLVHGRSSMQVSTMILSKCKYK